MKLKKLITALILFSLIILTAGCEHEQTEDICIVYTNDVASALDGNIGYAGVKGFRDEIAQDNRYVTIVDAGDFYDGRVATFSKGTYITEIMDAVGYEYVALGNQEFSIGLDALEHNIDSSDFLFLSCNVKYLGKGKDPLKNVKPYVIKKYGWTKVAFIGVTTPETLIPGKTVYNQILDENGEPLYDFYGGNEGQDLYDQVQKTVNKVRKKVDYVVILAHLGMNSVKPGYSSYELIANTTGIDVVIDAHSHTQNTGEPVADKEGHNVVLTSTGEKIQYVGLLRMHPDHTFTTVLYGGVDHKDETVQALVDGAYAQVGE